MDMSTTELGIICTFFATISLIRNRLKPQSAADFEAMRAMIRNEIKQLDAEDQQKRLDELTNALEKEHVQPSLTN